MVYKLKDHNIEAVQYGPIIDFPEWYINAVNKKYICPNDRTCIVTCDDRFNLAVIGDYIINDNGRLSVMQKGEFESKYEKIS